MKQLLLFLLSILLTSCGGGEYPKQFTYDGFRVIESANFQFSENTGWTRLDQTAEEIEELNNSVLEALNTLIEESNSYEDAIDLSSLEFVLSDENSYEIRTDNIQQASGNYEISGQVLFLEGFLDELFSIDDEQSQIAIPFYYAVYSYGNFTIPSFNTLEGLSLQAIAELPSEPEDGYIMPVAIVDMVFN